MTTSAVMTEATSTVFLIVGAGGSHGATGNHVARQLLAKGLTVRAFVHHDDDRSAALEALGAQIVVGDVGDFTTARAALEGVRRAYFTYPLADSLLAATTTFAAAGKQAGVESIVNMSQLTARPDHASPAARGHWLAERVLDWSGIGVTHIRPPYFLENLLTIADPAAMRSEGSIYLPYGQGRHAPVAGEDLARVAVGVLVDPVPHHGRTYAATGPISLSMAEQADTISRVLGRPIHYVDIPVEDWGQALAQAGFPPFLVEHLCHVAETHKHGEQDIATDVVETIGGSPPKTLEAFVDENRSAFEPTTPRGSPTAS
ncbi:NmrA family NAD(P)-binding protein [Pseudonocardia adelaidensis]|uniref:NmrA family NAD(P)-binding protein n=1 Tax=Pseudonocardia adelaidensis TaxID=648754 RepID=A0ABP9N6U3_9PSEU